MLEHSKGLARNGLFLQTRYVPFKTLLFVDETLKSIAQ